MNQRTWPLLRAAVALWLLHLVSATNLSENSRLPNPASNETLAASDVFTHTRTVDGRGTRFIAVTTYWRSGVARGVAAAVIVGALALAAIVLSCIYCCKRTSLSEHDTATAVLYQAPVPPQIACVAMQTMPPSGLYMYPPQQHWPPPAYEDPYAAKDGRGTFNPMMTSVEGPPASTRTPPPPYTIHGAHLY